MAVAESGQLNLETVFGGSRTIDSFQKLQQIGQGTYAQVYTAKDIITGEIVALKKIRMENEKNGFPITALREIRILSKLHHENIIKLKEILASPADDNDEKGGYYMVFEYMDHDLTGLARRVGKFSVPQTKCYLKQLLTGLHYCHVNQVLHRDIKGANLLIDNKGTLKLADFGLSRYFPIDEKGNLTNRVITLWFRPPELLLGSTKYGPAVDMWSVGCIFAELLDGKALFPGRDEAEQIYKIFELCGAPDESCWPGVTKLPWYDNLKPNRPMKRCLREHLRHLDHHALDLLENMLILDPAQRISTTDALDSEYFWTEPVPCDPKSLPKYESSHEFTTKKRHQQQRQQEEATKRQKLQRSPGSLPLPILPIQQSGQAQAQRQAGPNWPMHGSQMPVPSGPEPPDYHHGKPRGPSRHTLRGNHGGGRNRPYRGSHSGERARGSVSHLQHGQGPAYGSSGTAGIGPRGGGFGGHEGAKIYQQGGPYDGSSGLPGMGPQGGASYDTSGGLPGMGPPGGGSSGHGTARDFQQGGSYDGSRSGRGHNLDMRGTKHYQQHGRKH
ncbi:cyclin-dependent kinase C-2 isoform X2 [Beta vulgaris subsp. vulgaris]|uniref:cyclin-dependent kinase C-2 isoform X2 n=1 Tax=Beta vulgaris subsp. vulgaris TaxID=3555 RepID=UPI00254829C7|nr:cyclin-dependent kinase C-2 isoform X2 [Beta vulgaris subsp. vulgaris]